MDNNNPFKLTDSELLVRAMAIKELIKVMNYDEALQSVDIAMTLTFGVTDSTGEDNIT